MEGTVVGMAQIIVFFHITTRTGPGKTETIVIQNHEANMLRVRPKSVLPLKRFWTSKSSLLILCLVLISRMGM